MIRKIYSLHGNYVDVELDFNNGNSFSDNKSNKKIMNYYG